MKNCLFAFFFGGVKRGSYMIWVTQPSPLPGAGKAWRVWARDQRVASIGQDYRKTYRKGNFLVNFLDFLGSGAWICLLGAWNCLLGAWICLLGAWISFLGAWISFLGAWISFLGAWTSFLGAWISFWVLWS